MSGVQDQEYRVIAWRRGRRDHNKVKGRASDTVIWVSKRSKWRYSSKYLDIKYPISYMSRLIADTPRPATPAVLPPPVTVPISGTARPVQPPPTRTIVAPPHPPSPWLDRALAACIALLAVMILRKLAWHFIYLELGIYQSYQYTNNTCFFSRVLYITTNRVANSSINTYNDFIIQVRAYMPIPNYKLQTSQELKIQM